MSFSQSGSRDRGLFPQALFKFDHLERPVQLHLKNVYSCLSVGMLSAALGAYVHLIYGMGEWYILTALASIGFILALLATRHSKENVALRMGLFSAFTFCSGLSLGPLIDLVIKIDPSIVTTALAGTAVIFISLTMASLLSNDRKFIYLGGFLFSGLLLLTFVGLMNIFLQSALILDVQLYFSLALFSAFVLYDTQMIIERRRRGDEDFIWHSVELFIDALDIFRTLMVILAKKEASKKRKKDN